MSASRACSICRALSAVNGPNYGHVWDADIIDLLVDRFGDGINGQWRVPGEFGQRVTVTKDNTTLFASDRDMFVFLADEENRIGISEGATTMQLCPQPVRIR
jgi:hypothetical protein